MYCFFRRVLVIVHVINVKHYVDNINHKYTVTMATSPPSVNMADTLHILNDLSREAESKEMFDQLHNNIVASGIFF